MQHGNLDAGVSRSSKRGLGRFFGDPIQISPCSLLSDDALVGLHSEVLSSLLAVVPSDVAFCYAGSLDGSSQTSGSRWRGGSVEALPSRTLDSLFEQAVGDDIGGDELRVAVTRELGDPYCAPRWVICAPELAGSASKGLLVLFRHQGQCIGVGGVAYDGRDGSTRVADAIKLARLTPALSSLIDLHDKCGELRRRSIVNRAVPNFPGGLCVVDVDSASITWILVNEDAMRMAMVADEHALVMSAMRTLAPDRGAAPVRLRCGKLVRSVDLGVVSPFGPGRSVVLAVQPASRDDSSTALSLSKREQEIAHLLVSGYAAINAAAVLDLSEHTVRTYIRRLYRKLEVSNRADLVRKFVASEATSA